MFDQGLEMAWSGRARQLLDRYGEVAALIAIGALAFLPMIGALAALPLHVAPTYNEGWNAYQASAAMSGGALYPPPEALASNNYPPLSFYIVGAFGALVGDNILAGRLIALTAMMVVAAGVALLAGKLSGSARAGTIAALLFVGYSAVRTANNYVAINDPQWLAHALMTAGLAVFVFRRETLPGLLTAAALMLAGGLVKHLLIAAPIAVTIWLAVFDRKRLIAWLIGAGGMAVAALAICWALYGRNFFDSLISTPRIVSLEQALGYLDYWFTPLIAMAVATAFLALRAWSRDTALIVLYVLVAFGVGLMSMGGAGVNANATFDLVIALSIASGVAVNFVSQLAGPDHWPVRVMVVAGLSAGFALAAPIDIHRALLRLEQLPAERLAWEREIGRIRAVPGPVACETLSACYWAGKDFEIDFFILGQKLYIGKTSVDEAMAQLDARGVEALLVEKGWKGALLGQRLPEPMHAALAERFDVTPAYIEGHYFLTRKSTQP